MRFEAGLERFTHALHFSDALQRCALAALEQSARDDAKARH